MKRIAIATILLLAIPAAIAQVPSGDLSVTATAPGQYIDPTGSMDLEVTVSVGCALIITGGGSGTLSFDATVPSYIQVSADDVAVSAQDCSSSTSSATKTGTVTLTPDAGAPGLQAFNAKVVAVYSNAGGDAQAETQVDGLAVDYLGGHSMSMSGDQTIEVMNGTATIELDVNIMANAKTMVMFLDQNVSAGSISGLSHKVFDVAGGERNKTYTITYMAPTGAWTEATLKFHTYSHCLDKTEGCDPLFVSDPTWTFVNAGGSTSEEPDNEDSPSVALPMLIGAIGLIALARRRLE